MAWGVPVPGFDDGPKRAVVRPGTPLWKEALAAPVPTRRTIGVSLVMLALMLAVICVGSFLIVSGQPAIGLALIFAALGAPVAGWFASRPSVVAPPAWRYEGVSIEGEALVLLADIEGRFDYAHRLIDQIPAGMEWEDVQPHSQHLLWEAAGHAARVSALDAEMAAFRYAASGTPQMALKKTLEERRTDHWESMRRLQTEADSLARAAGNAAAAAKVALARTGSISALEIVAPSGRSLVAFEALSEARARLQLLADVWTELDESTLILQEKIAGELPQDGSGSTPTTS